LYSRRGVQEYWIDDWRVRQIEISRDQVQLALVATLHEADTLTSQLLPGFSFPVAEIFEAIPSQ